MESVKRHDPDKNAYRDALCDLMRAIVAFQQRDYARRKVSHPGFFLSALSMASLYIARMAHGKQITQARKCLGE
jgi:hypothetical protein